SIDFWSYFILYIPQPFYIIQIFMVIIGYAIIAYCIVLQLKANVVNNTAEGVVKAFAFKTSKHFGSIKLYLDISIVVISVIISFVSLGTIVGVCERTVISELIIWQLKKMFKTKSKKYEFYN